MYPYFKDSMITDFGFGGGFALWGFRAIASGQTGCCRFSAGFNQAFALDNTEVRSQHGGTRGRLAMNALKSFCHQLGYGGHRKIILSAPGSMRVTADEVSIISALSAAQQCHNSLCDAHLSWLLGSMNTHLSRQAATTYGMICKTTGIDIQPPQTGYAPESLPEQRHQIRAL